MERDKYKKFEEKYAWLKVLLDTYELSDNLVDKLIQKQGEQIACHKGCSNCCKNYNVPMLQPELAGISWYVCEVLQAPLRTSVYDNLMNHKETPDCPFLVNENCLIYEVRPLICRQFYVKNKACGTEEAVFETRFKDIVSPTNPMSKACSIILLDFWGSYTEKEKENIFESGFMVKSARPMHGYDWKNIAKSMNSF